MVIRRLGDIAIGALFWLWALAVLATCQRTWVARLQVGALAATGLILLGAAPERAIGVGIAFVVLAIIGIGWQVISGAAVGLFVCAIAAWAVGWHLPTP